MRRIRERFLPPLLTANPITSQVLGICSALAVTSHLETALVMSVAVTFVVSFSAVAVSLIRSAIPSAIRLVVQMTIIASLVIVTDQIIQAFSFDVSRQLSVYVGLIITNCIVLGRTESFAMANPPLPSFLDGIAHGLGYSVVLILVGVVRELLGTGRLLGVSIFPTVREGGWFLPNNLLLLPPSAFFLIALIVWGVRGLWPKQTGEEVGNV